MVLDSSNGNTCARCDASHAQPVKPVFGDNLNHRSHERFRAPSLIDFVPDEIRNRFARQLFLRALLARLGIGVRRSPRGRR